MVLAKDSKILLFIVKSHKTCCHIVIVDKSFLYNCNMYIQISDFSLKRADAKRV